MIIFIILLNSQTTYAESCTVTLDALNRLQAEADIRDKIEEPPFMVACREPPNLLKNRPKTGLLIRNIVEKDAQGRTTRDLLKKVLAKVKSRIIDTTFQMQNIMKCMSNSSAECEELKTWVNVDLPKYVREARFHLSLSQNQHQIRTWTSTPLREINAELDPLGTYKFKSWNPLTEPEKQQANHKFNIYLADIKAEAKKRLTHQQICVDCVEKFSDDALLSIRYQHYQAYHQMLAELPLIQYLSGPEVSKAELTSAFKEMKVDLVNELKQIAQYEKILTKNPLPSETLNILNYSSQLEETLLEDNRDCGLASSLVYTMTNRQLGNSIAIGLPILAVSFFAAPAIVALGGTAALGTAVGIGTGAAAGGGLAISSYIDFYNTQKRTMGYIYGDSLGADLNDLESSEKRVQYDAVTLPVGFGLGGMALRSLSVGVKSLQTGRKLFKAANK
jgi:hypothetical protein